MTTTIRTRMDKRQLREVVGHLVSFTTTGLVTNSEGVVIGHFERRFGHTLLHLRDRSQAFVLRLAIAGG